MDMKDAAKMLAAETGHGVEYALIMLQECRGGIMAALKELQKKPPILNPPDPDCKHCHGEGKWDSRNDCRSHPCPCTETKTTEAARAEILKRRIVIGG